MYTVIEGCPVLPQVHSKGTSCDYNLLLNISFLIHAMLHTQLVRGLCHALLVRGLGTLLVRGLGHTLLVRGLGTLLVRGLGHTAGQRIRHITSQRIRAHSASQRIRHITSQRFIRAHSAGQRIRHITSQRIRAHSAGQRITAQSAILRFIVYLQFDVPKQLQQITLEDIQKVATECSFLRQFQISVKDNTNVLQVLE